MQRIRCLKCDKFFDSEDKKINRVCTRCNKINNRFGSSLDLIYSSGNRRHKHSTGSK